MTVGDKPTSLFDYLSQAKENFEADKKKDAEKLFKESTKQYEKHVHSWYNYGVFLERIGKKKDAKKAYEKAMKIDPSFGPAIGNLGLLILQEKGYDDALRHFKKHAKEVRGHVIVWTNLGALYYAKNKYQDAEKAYRVSVKLAPKGGGASSLGRVLHMLKRPDESKEVIRERYGDQAAERHLRFCDFCQLGFVGFMLPRSPKIEELIEITQEFPDNPDSWWELGNALHAIGEDEEAVKALKKSIDAKPDFFEGWVNYGAALARSGMYDDAREAMDKAISLNPAHPAPYENLRRMSEDIGRYDDAIDATMKLMEINPDNELWVDISRLQLLKGNPEEAFTIYVKGIGEELNIEKSEDWIKFGKHIMKKDASMAQGCFGKALEKDKENAEAWFYSGYAYLLSGAVVPAQAMFMQALQRNKQYKPTVLKLLADRGIPPGILGMF